MKSRLRDGFGPVDPRIIEQVDELNEEVKVLALNLAIYLAKAKGKGKFELYGRRNALGGKSEILAAVTKAIEKDELVLEYQPKFCLTNHQVTGVEALIRWNHPLHGRIPPNLFLPAIQQTQVMTKLGEWVVDRAIKDMTAAIGLPTSLSEMGVSKDLFYRIITGALADHSHKTNPIDASAVLARLDQQHPHPRPRQMV